MYHARIGCKNVIGGIRMAKGEKKKMSTKKKLVYLVLLASLVVAVFCGRKKLKAVWEKVKAYRKK